MNEYNSSIQQMKELENKPLEFVDVDTFIKNHEHVCYCEALIRDDGYIAYTIPSHLKALIKHIGISEKEIYKLIPIQDDPLGWLIDHTKVVGVWYNLQIHPNCGCNEIQEHVLDLLHEKNIIIKNKRC